MCESECDHLRIHSCVYDTPDQVTLSVRGSDIEERGLRMTTGDKISEREARVDQTRFRGIHNTEQDSRYQY